MTNRAIDSGFLSNGNESNENLHKRKFDVVSLWKNDERTVFNPGIKDDALSKILSDFHITDDGIGSDALATENADSAKNIDDLRRAVERADRRAEPMAFEQFQNSKLQEVDLMSLLARSKVFEQKEGSVKPEALESSLRTVRGGGAELYRTLYAPGVARVNLGLALLARGSDTDVQEAETYFKAAFRQTPELLMSQTVRDEIVKAYPKDRIPFATWKTTPSVDSHGIDAEKLTESISEAIKLYKNFGIDSALPLFEQAIKSADQIDLEKVQDNRLENFRQLMVLNWQIQKRHDSDTDLVKLEKEKDGALEVAQELYDRYMLPAVLRVEVGLSLIESGNSDDKLDGLRYFAKAAEMRREVLTNPDLAKALDKAFVTYWQKQPQEDAIDASLRAESDTGEARDNSTQFKFRPKDMFYKGADDTIEIQPYFVDKVTGPLLGAGLLYGAYKLAQWRMQRREANSDKGFVSADGSSKTAQALAKRTSEKNPEVLEEAARILDSKLVPGISDSSVLDHARKSLLMASQEPELSSLEQRVEIIETAKVLSSNPTKADFSDAKNISDFEFGVQFHVSEVLGGEMAAKLGNGPQIRALSRLVAADQKLGAVILNTMPVEGLISLKGTDRLTSLLNTVTNSNSSSLAPKLEALASAFVSDRSILNANEAGLIFDRLYDKLAKPTTIFVNDKQCGLALTLLTLGPDRQDATRIWDVLQQQGADIYLAHNKPLETIATFRVLSADVLKKFQEPYTSLSREFTKKVLEYGMLGNIDLSSISSENLAWILRHHNGLDGTASEMFRQSLNDHFARYDRSVNGWSAIMEAGAAHTELRETLVSIASRVSDTEWARSGADIDRFKKAWNRALPAKCSTVEALHFLNFDCRHPTEEKYQTKELITAAMSNADDLPKFLEVLDGPDRAKLFMRLVEGTMKDKLVNLLRSADTVVCDLGEGELTALKNRFREVFSKKDATSIVEAIEKIAASKTGQHIEAQTAKALLEQFAPGERRTVIDYLKSRAQFCSIAGLEQVFTDFSHSLTAGGPHTRFVTVEGGDRGKMVSTINVLATKDGSGTGRSYNNFKATGMNHNFYFMQESVDGKPFLLCPNGDHLAIENQGGRPLGRKIFDGKTARPVSEQAKELPQFVLMDRPAQNGNWSSAIDRLVKDQRVYVPESIVGSLDGTRHGFADGVNFFDLALADSDPAEITALAKKIRTHCRLQESNAPAGRVLDSDPQINELKNSVVTKAMLEDQVLAMKAILFAHEGRFKVTKDGEQVGFAPESIEHILTKLDAASFRTMTKFMQIARDLNTSLTQRLGDKGLSMNDAIFVINDKAGSEFVVHEIFRRVCPELRNLTPEQLAKRFVTMSELKHTNVNNKAVVLLDDGFDFGPDCIDEKLGKTMNAYRGDSALGKPKGIFIGSFFSFESERVRKVYMERFLAADEFHGEFARECPIEMISAMEVRQSFARDVRLLDPRVDIRKLSVPAKDGTTTTFRGRGEIWPYLVPNNTSGWLSAFVKTMGHYGTRNLVENALYEPLSLVSADYVCDVSGRDLNSMEKATRLKMLVEQNIHAMSCQRPGGIPKLEERALQHFRDGLTNAIAEGEQCCEQTLAVVDDIFKTLPEERAASMAILRRDVINGTSAWSSRQLDLNHQQKYTFETPVAIPLGEKSALVKSIECKRGEIELTYEMDGKSRTETVRAVTPEAIASSPLAEYLLKTITADGIHANNFTRSTLWANFLDEVANPKPKEVDSSDEKPTEINPEELSIKERLKAARTNVNRHEFDVFHANYKMSKNCQREFKFDFSKPITVDHHGQKIELTGINHNWKSEIVLTGRVGDGPLREPLAQEVRDSLLAELSKHIRSSLVSGGTNEIKSRLLASYLEHSDQIRVEIAARRAEAKYGQVTEAERTLFSEAIAEMRRLTGPTFFEKEAFIQALQTVKSKHGGNLAGSVDLDKLIDQYRKNDPIATGRVEDHFRIQDILDQTRRPESSLSLDFNPLSHLFQPRLVQTRLTSRGPVFVMANGQEIASATMSRKQMVDVMDEDIRLKSEEIQAKGKNATKADLEELARMKDSRDQFTRRRVTRPIVTSLVKSGLRKSPAIVSVGVVAGWTLKFFDPSYQSPY